MAMPSSALKLFIHAYLRAFYGFRNITGTGAFGRRGAKYVHAPLQAENHRLKTALFRHHVKQFNEASCSVASIVSVINAIKAEQDDNPAPISQMDILEKVDTANWKERMGENGDNGRRGLPLTLLGMVVKSSLDAYGVRYKAIETVPARSTGQSAKIKEDLWKRLRNFEKSGGGVILAHFDQGVYVRALHIPHISPVGGFDLQNGDVTILDVDPQQEKPYTVTFGTFYRGLSSNYHHLFRPFGYGRGGYVHVELQG